MEYARIRKEESEMERKMFQVVTQEDIKRLGLDRKGKWQYTVKDLEKLPEWVHAELIDGEIFVRMTSPATIHQDILMGLSFQVELYIQKKKGKCHVFQAPFGVQPKKDDYNYVEPDITLICNDEVLNRKGCFGAPDLVIEIVSPSNRKMDYVRKLTLYRETGVREYWIVDPKHEQVTVYDFEHGGEPTLHPFSERIKVGVYDDLYLDIANRHNTLEEVLSEERQTSLADGLEEGRAEGLADGLKQGRTEGLADGLKQGRAEGESKFAELAAFLLREGRTDDLSRAASDAAYREQLYQQM